MKVVTYYPNNRKMYDRDECKYTNLTKLLIHLQNSGTLQVIDKQSGEDVTNRILREIVGVMQVDNEVLLDFIVTHGTAVEGDV